MEEKLRVGEKGARVDTGGGPGEECKPESSQFLLFEPGVEGEGLTKSSEEIAGAKGVDAFL